MSRIHKLNARISFGVATLDPDGDLAFQVECPQVDDYCRGFAECISPDCDIEELERLHHDEGDSEPILHGAAHHLTALGWCLPLDECFVVENPSLYEVAREFLLDHELSPSGDYLVEHEFVDGELEAFHLSAEKWPAQPEPYVDPLSEAVDHPLLNQRVRVVLARAGSPVGGGQWEPEGPEPARLEEDSVAIGVLERLEAGGQCEVVDDDGVKWYCWPALDITAAP